jgi:hypothetical protein
MFETTGPGYGNTEHINGDEQDFNDDKLGLGALRRLRAPRVECVDLYSVG